jgi:hypothetical protein
MKINTLKIPDSIIKLIDSAWAKPGITAQNILRQSDFYIENPKTPTPWDKDFVRKAQLAYYLPLNLIRSMRVYKQLKNNPNLNFESFFSGIENYWELGSGLSPSYFALKETFPSLQFSSVNFIESSQYAQEFHKSLLTLYMENLNNQNLDNHHWIKKEPTRNDKISKDLVVCSYALTEFEVVPEWLFQAKAIIIIEPATREDGRKLLALRSDLIKNGFEIWAPCLHQMNCPLLQETKNDWCHDRVHFEKPEAFQKIENLLPIKNDTLTLSYLVAKKKSDIKTDSASSLSTNTVRVIGDFLNEKGKSRQLICRNSKREFLTQLKRKLTPLEFERGDILKISSPIKEIGNELRTDSDLTDIKKIN